MAEWRFDAIGVPWSIETAQDIEPSTRQRISDRIAAFDRAYSRFREDSLVAEVAKKPGDYVFPDDLSDLLAVYDRLFQATRGAINPLVGRALEHWGYDANYRLAPHAGHPPPVPSLKDSISVTGTTLHAPRPVLLDIGAVGKGFLVDRVSELLLEAGVDDSVVDASGDIRHSGEDSERVGLEHPDHPDRVVVSPGYRINLWQRQPQTDGRGPERIIFWMLSPAGLPNPFGPVGWWPIVVRWPMD